MTEQRICGIAEAYWDQAFSAATFIFSHGEVISPLDILRDQVRWPTKYESIIGTCEQKFKTATVVISAQSRVILPGGSNYFFAKTDVFLFIDFHLTTVLGRVNHAKVKYFTKVFVAYSKRQKVGLFHCPVPRQNRNTSSRIKLTESAFLLLSPTDLL